MEKTVTPWNSVGKISDSTTHWEGSLLFRASPNTRLAFAFVFMFKISYARPRGCLKIPVQPDIYYFLLKCFCLESHWQTCQAHRPIVPVVKWQAVTLPDILTPPNTRDDGSPGHFPKGPVPAWRVGTIGMKASLLAQLPPFTVLPGNRKGSSKVCTLTMNRSFSSRFPYVS